MDAGLAARRSNGANTLALLVSAGAACVAPLQVFVLAYVFLGPAHYLTEIAWLGKKRFYVRRGGASVGAFVAVASVLCAVATVDFYRHKGYAAWAVGAVLALALGVWARRPYVLGAGLAAAVAAKFYGHGMVLLLAAILPTILHVYVFTGVFMVNGLLRERRPGVLAWVNPVLLVGIPAVLLRPLWAYPAPGAYWVHAEGVFRGLFGYLAGLLGHGAGDGSVMTDAGAAGVLRFVAFMYLYHYLNWFTKTELLEWHKVSRRSWGWIGTVYAGCVGVYLWNFTVGFYVVNFLSLLHIFLEFPLNWQTGHFVLMAAVGGRRRIAPGAAVVEVAR